LKKLTLCPGSESVFTIDIRDQQVGIIAGPAPPNAHEFETLLQQKLITPFFLASAASPAGIYFGGWIRIIDIGQHVI